MSGSVLPSIQNVVKAKLSGDSAFSGLVTGVFDQVPSGQAYPYVVLGEKSETDFSSFERGGSRVTLMLEIHSQAPASNELLQVYSRIKAVLDHLSFETFGYSVVMGSTTLLKTTVDDDGVTRRGEARYEAIVQDSPISPGLLEPPPPDPEPEPEPGPILEPLQ